MKTSYSKSCCIRSLLDDSTEVFYVIPYSTPKQAFCPHLSGQKNLGPKVGRAQEVSLARQGRSIVDNHHLLRLLTGEKQGNEPADERNPELDVDDGNRRLVRAVPLDGSDGGQKVDV